MHPNQAAKGAAIILALMVLCIAVSTTTLIRLQLKNNIRYTERMIASDHCAISQFNARQLQQPVPHCDV